MKQIYLALAWAVSVTAASMVQAEQRQQYGRDSVYSVPGTTTRSSPSVLAAPTTRLGRDSVYATQTPNVPSTPVSADARSLQQYGRDSVYTIGSPNAPGTTNGGTMVGTTGQGHGG